MENQPSEANPFFEIEQKEGAGKRLTIESDISLDTEALKEIQNGLKEKIENFTPKEIGNLHLTFGHFGRPSDLYEELTKTVPALSRSDFEIELQKLLLGTEKILSGDISTRATDIKIFESGAVVLIIGKEQLLGIKYAVYNATLKFLSNLGVPDPDEYIQSSTAADSNLHFLLPSRWDPHVTLGYIKNDKETDVPQKEELLETIDMEVSFHPSYVRNASRKA